jgi:hypothetical protein
MVTHVDAQVSALISGWNDYDRQYRQNLHNPTNSLSEDETGVEECKKLAAADPAQAVKNVYSYGFFIVNTPALHGGAAGQGTGVAGQEKLKQ